MNCSSNNLCKISAHFYFSHIKICINDSLKMMAMSIMLIIFIKKVINNSVDHLNDHGLRKLASQYSCQPCLKNP